MISTILQTSGRQHTQGQCHILTNKSLSLCNLEQKNFFCPNHLLLAVFLLLISNLPTFGGLPTLGHGFGEYVKFASTVNNKFAASQFNVW